MTDIRLKLPIRTVSELNTREHWAKTHRRRKMQREVVGHCLNTKQRPSLPVDVFLTRLAPRAFDRGDNLNASFKAIRDQIAAWLGVDDADERVVWHYDQRKGKPKEYAVLIEVLTDD